MISSAESDLSPKYAINKANVSFLSRNPSRQLANDKALAEQVGHFDEEGAAVAAKPGSSWPVKGLRPLPRP
jgi:hypothetical protein